MSWSSGRIDESQFSTLVLSSKKLKKRQARQAQHEQNLLRNVDDEMEDFFDLRSQERGSDSDVELYASEEEEESDESSDEESAAEESRPNALQWSS